jgi:hypothetical protein
MDQVSRPLLVVLLATVCLAGAWMTVLRPRAQHASSSSPAPVAHAAPGAAGLGRAVDRANGAVAASQRSATHAERAAGQGPAAVASKARAATPSATVHKAAPRVPTHAPARQTGSTLVMNALLHGDSVVLLFAGQGADDQLARRVVASIHEPKVRTISASIDDLASYAAVTTGVQVASAPTILVIGPDRRAHEIDGLPDVQQVLSALIDARHGA